jgi:hypothetical protein
MSSPRLATCQALKPAGRSISRCEPSGVILSSRAFWDRAVAAGGDAERAHQTGSDDRGAGPVALGRVDPGDLAGVVQRHVELAVAADLDAVGP